MREASYGLIAFAVLCIIAAAYNVWVIIQQDRAHKMEREIEREVKRAIFRWEMEQLYGEEA